MTTKRFFTKMRGYWHYWQSGRQEERFGIKNFLVVTITSSDERAENLCVATRELASSEHHSLRMFLFGSETLYAAPECSAVLTSIWATAEGGSRHSFLE